MPQSMTTARDIPILITSTATSSSERRITPSWTIAHLKIKLEPVTGIAPSSQILTLRLPDRQQDTPIQAEDEETVEIGTWPLVPYAEIKVTVSVSDFFSFLFFFFLFVCDYAHSEANDFPTSIFGKERRRLSCPSATSLHLYSPAFRFPAFSA